MLDKFKQRSHRLEYIDTGNYTAEEYEGCISELQFVNRWMGDAHSLKATLLREIESQSLTSFSILDIGAGSGELLRVAATWARQTNRRLRAVGGMPVPGRARMTPRLRFHPRSQERP